MCVVIYYTGELLDLYIAQERLMRQNNWKK